jgi:hypothetical protein
LRDDDLITPISDSEYVLQGSEILPTRGDNPVRILMYDCKFPIDLLKAVRYCIVLPEIKDLHKEKMKKMIFLNWRKFVNSIYSVRSLAEPGVNAYWIVLYKIKDLYKKLKEKVSNRFSSSIQASSWNLALPGFNYGYFIRQKLPYMNLFI